MMSNLHILVEILSSRVHRIFVLCFLVVSACLILTSTSSRALADETHHQPVITMKIPVSSARKNQYVELLLTSAISISGAKPIIEYFEFPSNQSRINKLLQTNSGLDLAWLPVDKERLSSISYVPLPIYKGLHGNRLLLIHRDRQKDFSAIDSLQGLAELVALQNKHWSDFNILIENGLTVNGELDVEEMYKAIADRLGDYFPRSALTIAAEQQRKQYLPIAIEQELAVVYPMYLFFFVNNNNPELLTRLTNGFRIMIETGEMTRIFNQFYGIKTTNLNLSERRTFVLQNKRLPKSLESELMLSW